jgi:transglutaminase-like putative cysteine protease
MRWPGILLAPTLACLLAFSPGAVAAEQVLDSLIALQRQRAGGRAAELFAPLAGTELRGEEREDYRFLLANLPLSDLAELAAADLVENLRLARRARADFPWGAQVPDELWRHYVLPHRVSQEPFTRWRGPFLAELAPRLAGLAMGEAALEVNHWCHEQATYRPTDGRDQDPLTTLRAGYGRCEEEMILAIAALRSVGIPARQCYTPYWAHMDDNHAWVELWVDGAWTYLGACEPAPALGEAWFSGPAARAMLVVSQAWGAVPPGAEPVLRREGRSTSVNSTAVYGPVKTLRLEVVDGRGRPLPACRIVFHLFNYGGWIPALAQRTDGQGRLELACGEGSWWVTAEHQGRSAQLHVEAGQRQARLVLDKPGRSPLAAAADYRPPAARPAAAAAAGLISAEGLARGLVDTAAVRRADHDFQRLLQRNDSLREARLCGRWLPEWQRAEGGDCPDSLALREWLDQVSSAGWEPSRVLDLYRRARGNWGVIHSFAAGVVALPGADGRLRWGALPVGCDAERVARLELLAASSDKDLAELDLATLRDHEAVLAGQPRPSDSLALARWRAHVLPPRLGGEPCRPWRGALAEFLAARPELAASRGDRALLAWMRRHLRRDEAADRLGAPLTPAQVLSLGGGTTEDLRRLYLGFCRARGLPARIEPLSGRLERWEAGSWRSVVLFKEKERALGRPAGRLLITAADSLSAMAPCFKDWCLARWMEGHLEPVDLGWQEPLSALAMPLELPAGRYLLSSGRRREDGSADVRMEWVTVERGREATVRLRVDPADR